VSVTLKDIAPRLRIPAYIVTAYIGLGSFVDMFVSSWPAQPHDLRWRLLFEGFATTASGSEMLALLLFLAFAWAAADRIALAFGFSFSLVAAAAYLCCAVIFLLDSLQIKSQVRGDQVARFDLGLLWTGGRLVFTGFMFALFATVAFRAFRSLSRPAERAAASSKASLIVGNKPQQAAERVNA
jgi:hypothetical protein